MTDPISNEAKEKKSDFWLELGKLIVIAVVVVIPFRLWIAQPFIVDGASMDPTFATGQYLVVDELSYHFHAPARGSVLIFKYPKDTSKYFIKRVIGLPGETVKIQEGLVTIINMTHPQGMVLNEPYVVYKKPDSLTFTLANDEYFVMGDNRYGSADSRLWGPVPTKDIVGRPIVRFWPPTIWPGDKTNLINVQTY